MTKIRPSVVKAKKLRVGDRFVLGTSSHLIETLGTPDGNPKYVSVEAHPANDPEGDRFYLVLPLDMPIKIYNR